MSERLPNWSAGMKINLMHHYCLHSSRFAFCQYPDKADQASNPFPLSNLPLQQDDKKKLGIPTRIILQVWRRADLYTYSIHSV